MLRELAGPSRRDEFRAFAAGLSAEERSLLKSRLSSQVPSFFDGANLPINGNSAFAGQLQGMAEMLHSLAVANREIPDNGIAHRGRPGWLTAELMTSLRDEAADRRHKPLDRTDHYLGCGGIIADRLSVSGPVVEYVERYVGPVVSTGIASYLYYDRPGLGIRPHVDTDVFSINLMIMLKHEPASSADRSATLVFPAGGPPERHVLQRGEAMIMYGGSVIHARSIVAPGEAVHLLTIGFNCARTEP